MAKNKGSHFRKSHVRVYESKNGKRYSRPSRHLEELKIKYGVGMGVFMFLFQVAVIGTFIFFFMGDVDVVWKIIMIVIAALYFAF